MRILKKSNKDSRLKTRHEPVLSIKSKFKVERNQWPNLSPNPNERLISYESVFVCLNRIRNIYTTDYWSVLDSLEAEVRWKWK